MPGGSSRNRFRHEHPSVKRAGLLKNAEQPREQRSGAQARGRGDARSRPDAGHGGYRQRSAPTTNHVPTRRAPGGGSALKRSETPAASPKRSTAFSGRTT